MSCRALRKVVPWALGPSLSSTLPAAAQTDEQRAAARSLATEGAAAFNEGRFKDAVDLFSRAENAGARAAASFCFWRAPTPNSISS